MTVKKKTAPTKKSKRGDERSHQQLTEILGACDDTQRIAIQTTITAWHSAIVKQGGVR